MSNESYTHIAVIVDRSGSMFPVRDDMVGGLNELFKSQAEVPGLCLVDYVQFDSEYELVYEDKPVQFAKAELDPRGSTALLDAIGKTVSNLTNKWNDKDESERPGKVIVVIVTDGCENASREWSRESVKAAVEKQTEAGWEFLFLGANMDAVSEGGSYGIAAGSSLTYDTANTGAVLASAGEYIIATRTVGHASFTSEDRENAVK